MKENDLKILWKSVSDFEMVNFDRDLINKEIKAQLNSFDRKIITRDVIEISVAILIIPVAIFIAYVLPNILIRTGAILMIPSILLIIYKILQVRKFKKPVDSLLNIRAYLETNLVYYKKQYELLDSVLYWYILPSMLCAILIITGLKLPTLKFFYALSITLGVAFVIYRLNKLTVIRKLDPLIKKIESELEELK